MDEWILNCIRESCVAISKLPPNSKAALGLSASELARIEEIAKRAQHK